MKINKHNLIIAKHCSESPVDGFSTNGLQFSPHGTSAMNRYYSVEVSALQVDERPTWNAVSLATARELFKTTGDGEKDVTVSELLPMPLKTVRVKNEIKPPVFEIVLNAEYFLALAQAFVDFQGEICRIQFSGPDDQVVMDAKNIATGQTLKARLMPRRSGGDTWRFVEEPDETEEERAMRIAQELMAD